jgi:hypothetical protein
MPEEYQKPTKTYRVFYQTVPHEPDSFLVVRIAAASKKEVRQIFAVAYPGSQIAAIGRYRLVED